MAMGPTTTASVPQRTEGFAGSAPGGAGGLGRGAGAAPAPAAEPQMGPDGSSSVSPEEQQQYDQFVNKAYELIYNNNQVNPQVLESLKGDGQPMDGLANTTAMVVMRVEDAAREAGQEVSPDVVFHGGAEILEDLADLAQQAGIHTFDDKELEGASYQALDIYRDQRQKQGKLDMGAIQQDFSQMIEADQMGTLGQMLPGIEENSGSKTENSANGSGTGKKRRRRGKRKGKGLM